jgi:transcriptional regulator with XRE-family HTH domain
MATTLNQIMAALPVTRRKRIEERAAARVAEELALRDLRKAMGKTQVEVARKLRISQVSLSDTERRADVMLSTLRKYVVALGGELDLIARFPNRAPVKISHLADIAPPGKPSGQRKGRASAAGRRRKIGAVHKAQSVAA